MESINSLLSFGTQETKAIKQNANTPERVSSLANVPILDNVPISFRLGGVLSDQALSHEVEELRNPLIASEIQVLPYNLAVEEDVEFPKETSRAGMTHVPSRRSYETKNDTAVEATVIQNTTVPPSNSYEHSFNTYEGKKKVAIVI